MSSPAPSLAFFDLKTLAKTLRLSSIDVIKTSSTEIESRWFRTSGPADLYYWKSKDKIVKHQVTLFNQVVEWNEFDGVKTGFLSEDSAGGEHICFDKELNREVLVQVREFLSHTEQLESDILERIIGHHQFFNRWQSNALVRFISKVFRLS